MSCSLARSSRLARGNRPCLAAAEEFRALLLAPTSRVCATPRGSAPWVWTDPRDGPPRL